VLAMSGYSEQELADRFAGQRVKGFLHKPFEPDDLLAALARVLPQH
jgi:hypothetical protein